MTILTPPTWLENSAVHNAQDYRTMLASLVAGRSGIADPDAFEVTEKSGTPDMSVDVAAGGLFVASTRASSAGVYHVYNDGVVNVPLSAADATNDRIDRVLVQVRDEEQDAALTQNDARVLVVEGTPSSEPAAPAITVEDYVELAQVTVPAAASSITDSDIDDMRERTSTLGGVTPCTSSTRPTSPVAGEFVFETDTGRVYVYDGSAWQFVSSTSREEAQHAGIVPGSSDDTTTASPSYGAWGGTVNVTVPPWATKARVVATASGVYPQTSSGAVIDLRIAVGSAVSQPKRFTVYGAADTPRESLAIVTQVTGLTAGVQAVGFQESRISGGGSFRADSNSDFDFAIDFLP